MKTPIVTFAKRTTFVIGKDRKVLSVETGSDAIDPSAAVTACSIR